jgi:hypothetical protein
MATVSTLSRDDTATCSNARPIARSSPVVADSGDRRNMHNQRQQFDPVAGYVR